MKKALFDAVGGFPDMPITEDVATRRYAPLRKHRVCAPLATVEGGGPRRLVSDRSQMGFTVYWVGVGPDRLADYYAHVRGR